MKILVTGATGFIGGALSHELIRAGHGVSVLSRSDGGSARFPTGAASTRWDPGKPAPGSAFEGVDAIVHLAGEPVNGRWTATKRKAILDSRVDGTRNLLTGVAAAEHRPPRLICASAVGYYGDRGEELLDETSAAGDDFLSGVCLRWEAAAAEGRTLGLSVSSVRLGIVLGRDGGALAPLRLATRLGLGGPLGTGRQWWSWIHVDDAVRAIEHILASPAQGAFNLVAPEPVRQRDFARVLGETLHRPSLLRAPAPALHVALGGLATELLSSRRVSCAKLAGVGFTHRFATLEHALTDLWHDADG
jgi:uncharacterized protein